MTDTAHPGSYSAHGQHSTYRVDETNVTWFGASHRLIGGKPDSRYGWLEIPGLGLYIVKEIDTGLTAYASTLLNHERKMLRRLAELGAPAPALLDVGRDDWLVTRFAGLSLQRLQHSFTWQEQAQGLGFAETLAAWIHLLRRLQTMADQGVLVIDLYEANAVCPLTGQTTGQLRLNEAALIDHAHTMEAGMALRRPVWLDPSMDRIPPELRQALEQDQNALRATFSEIGAALPGLSCSTGARGALSRQAWAEYDSAQQLQQLLDKGDLSRDHAMQFSIGAALARLARLCPHAESRRALMHTVSRMKQPNPKQRYPSMNAAADALQTLLRRLPLVSASSYGPLSAQDLATPKGTETTMADEVTALWTSGAPRHGLDALVKPEQPAPRSNLMPWLYAAVAMGAAVGTMWPLPQ